MILPEGMIHFLQIVDSDTFFCVAGKLTTTTKEMNKDPLKLPLSTSYSKTPTNISVDDPSTLPPLNPMKTQPPNDPIRAPTEEPIQTPDQEEASIPPPSVRRKEPNLPGPSDATKPKNEICQTSNRIRSRSSTSPNKT